MHPRKLTEFASSVQDQVHALTPHVRRTSVQKGVYGDFDAAHALTERLDTQLDAVHQRLQTSVQILHALSEAAKTAAAMTTQSDQAAAASMRHVQRLIGSAEQQLDLAQGTVY